MEREDFGLPKLDFPLPKPPTEVEWMQRQKLLEHTLSLRDKIGPLDLTWDELSAGNDSEEEDEERDD